MRTYKLSLPLQTAGTKFEGARFDVIFLLALLWFLTGVCLDAWAHAHLARLETFFTPWHAVLYSGAFVTALVLFVTTCFNRSRTNSWREAIPGGYELTVLAVAGFLIGGVGDMAWHVLFGIERNIDAELSPTHIWLMVCGAVFLASPYRVLYHQSATILRGWQKLNLIIAQAIMMMLPTIVMITFHPLAQFWPTYTLASDETGQALGVVSIFFTALVTTGFALFTVQRWRLFPGFFTLAWLLNAIPLAVLSDSFLTVLIAGIAGLLTDLAYYFLHPGPEEPLVNYRFFAMLVPSFLFLTYFLVLQFATPTGVVWTIHLSVGSIVVSGVLGLLLTYLIKPPAIQKEAN
jgi:hypothetical protein